MTTLQPTQGPYSGDVESTLVETKEISTEVPEISGDSSSGILRNRGRRESIFSFLRTFVQKLPDTASDSLAVSIVVDSSAAAGFTDAVYLP